MDRCSCWVHGHLARGFKDRNANSTAFVRRQARSVQYGVIGAFVDEILRQRRVAIRMSVMQRSVPTVVLAVNVRAGLDQQLRAALVPILARDDERRVTELITHVRLRILAHASDTCT